MMLAPTIYMLQIYDRVMHSRSELTLLAVSLLTLALFTFMSISEWGRNKVLPLIGLKFDQKISRETFETTFSLHAAGRKKAARASISEMAAARQFISSPAVFIIFDVLWTPAFIFILFILHPLLGWTGVVAAIAQGLTAYFGHRHSEKSGHILNDSQRAQSSQFRQDLEFAETNEVLGINRHIRKQTFARIFEHKALEFVFLQKQNVANSCSQAVRLIQQSVTLGIGALLVVNGEISAGAMIAANIFTTRAITPIDQLLGSLKGWSNFNSSLKQIAAIQEFQAKQQSRSQAPRSLATLQLKDAGATTGNGTVILNQIDFQVQQGEIAVIMGPSGSGKSTLARLILGLWPNPIGHTAIGDFEINFLQKFPTRNFCGYLPQTVQLFSGTVADNIARLGDINSHKVIKAAKDAGLHEHILQLPNGYNTQVENLGSMLSAGQKQRIGLARAIYDSPRILVLDEPNSNLDEAGEFALMNALVAMKAEGSIVIVISHRQHILSVADLKIHLKNGQVERIIRSTHGGNQLVEKSHRTIEGS